MNTQQRIIYSLIQGNLQQAWDLLGTADYELAKRHLAQAIEQVDQMRDAMEPTIEPQPEQPSLPLP